ncbi:glycoside hydrolase family 19 protein [Sorangium sp. So ce1036]|uniref:glycoside hydrolase family 19 protein n=1 Tax=Sorangium sp. So ce1036 TaxID=3133328 RepID=UPI003F0595E2
MSHQLGIIPGSFLSLAFIAAAVSASGCLAETSLDEEGFDGHEAAMCSSAPGWAEGVAYTIGSVVSHGGKSYSCRQSHTSLAGWTPAAVPALWQETGTCSGSSTSSSSSGGNGSGSGCSYPAWQQGKNYRTGDIVLFNGSAYVAEHDNPGYDPTISTWFWDPHAGCGGGGSGNGSGGGGGGGGSGFGAILSESVFNTMFPARNPFYTYQALIAAASTFPGLATTGDADTRKREVAAFLANVSHETGGLVYVEEIAKAPLCDTSWGPPGCGCAPGKSYYGRGPMQLSWNGNYCAAGNALGLPLQSNPDLLAQDANAAWRSAFWFWTTQTGAGAMTAHDAIVTGAGFGETIRTINGALECNGRNPAQVQSRVNRYMQFARLLGVSPGDHTGC